MTVMPCLRCGEYLEDNKLGVECPHCGWMVGLVPFEIGIDTVNAALEGKTQTVWKPIKTAPKKKFVLIRGESGYGNYPAQIMLAEFDPDFRDEFTTIGGDRVSDYGLRPTHWTEVPK